MYKKATLIKLSNYSFPKIWTRPYPNKNNRFYYMAKFMALLSLLTIVLPSCFSIFGEPETTPIKSLANQNKIKKAVLLQNDGNATVDISLSVSILDYDYTFSGNEIGNAFVVDENHGRASIDSSSINLIWFGNDTLQIDYDRRLRKFLQQKKLDGVTIIYKER